MNRDQKNIDEFSEFMLQSQSVSPEVTKDIKIAQYFYHHFYSTLWTLFMHITASAFITLYFCPQFGIGGGRYNLESLYHHLPSIACACFCSGVYFSIFISSLFLSAPEKRDLFLWILKRYSFLVVVFPLSLWAGLMLVGASFGGHNHHNTASFHITWMSLGAVILAVIYYFQSRRRIQVTSNLL